MQYSSNARRCCTDDSFLRNYWLANSTPFSGDCCYSRLLIEGDNTLPNYDSNSNGSPIFAGTMLHNSAYNWSVSPTPNSDSTIRTRLDGKHSDCGRFNNASCGSWR